MNKLHSLSAVLRLTGLTYQHCTENHLQRYLAEYDFGYAAEKYDPMACVTALDKLAGMGGGGGGLPWLQTHPSPAERSKRIKQQLG